MPLNSYKTDLMSTSLSYSNNFDEGILLNNVMIRQSDQKKNKKPQVCCCLLRSQQHPCGSVHELEQIKPLNSL